MEALEKLVDETSVARVLEILVAICYEKAQHIRKDQQDELTAVCWERVARDISKTKTYGR